MGAKASSQNEQYSRMLSGYEVIQQNRQEGLRYLENKTTKQQFMLREHSCHDRQLYNKTLATLKDRQKQLTDNRHIVPLVQLINYEQDQYCMTYFKIYALWEFPQRTLEDQINERLLQKRKFQEKELWSILASCILALSHFQKEDIKHNALKSSSILINPEGLVKLYDPITIGATSNYETLLAHRTSPHLYLSPQQTDSLREERSYQTCDPFKSDIWTLGMILMEGGLLTYQDECYRDQCSRIHWETLQINIDRFKQSYSVELASLLEFMLARDQRARPDWAELEQHVIKFEEDAKASCVSQPSQQQERSIDKVFQYVTSPPKIQHKDRSFNLSKQYLSTSKLEIIPQPQEVMVRQMPGIQTPVQLIQPMQQMQPIQQIQPIQSFQPLQPSNISATRPFRNIFPNNQYITATNFDQNMVEVNEQSQQSYANGNSIHVSRTNSYFPANSANPPLALGEFVCERYKQGSRYEGYKLGEFKHGYGKFYYQDGGMYEGQWDLGRMSGFGRLFYQSDRLAYEGNWLNDQFSGKGTLYNEFPQQLRVSFDYHNFDEIEEYWTKYEGDFVEDMKHGKGVLFLSNGEYFKGQFQNDYAEGQGSFFTMQKTIVSGVWRSNLMEWQSA